MLYEILGYLRTQRILKNDSRWYSQKQICERFDYSPKNASKVFKKLQEKGYLEARPSVHAGRPCFMYRFYGGDRWAMALAGYELEHKHQSKRRIMR